MNDFLKLIDGIGIFGKSVGLFITGFIAWFFVRKKQNADTLKSRADAVKTETETAIVVQKFNKELYNEVAAKLDVVMEKLKKTEEENKLLRQEVDQLKRILNARDTFKSIEKK